MLKLHTDSHRDHALSGVQVTYILERYADRDAFFIDTFELPEHLGEVSCGLYGPLMGDEPVTEARLGMRGNRAYPSRLVQLPPRPTRQVTVIAGPHDGESCIVYTMFGGPLAPKEPGETAAAIVAFVEKLATAPEVDDPNEQLMKLLALHEAHAKSKAFWAEHALAL